MPGGRHACKRVAMDMSVGSLSNLGNKRRKPLSIDIYQNLNFDRNGIMFVFYTGLPHMIFKCCERSKDWNEQLSYLLFAYHANVQDSTKESPFFLLYRRDPRMPSESALNSPSSPYMVDSEGHKSELTSSLSGAWEIARANIQNAQVHQKHQYDKQQRS